MVSFFGEHDLVGRTHPDGPCMSDGKVVPNPGPICLSPGLSKFLGIQQPGPEAEKIIRTASPATYIQKDMPPYLLIHGTKDFNVPFEQSVMMAEELKKQGVPFQFHKIAKAEHGLSGGDHAEIEEAERKAFEFVKLYLEK